MTNHPEPALSRSLDAMDAARRRVYATFIFYWLITFSSLLWFVHILHTTDNLKKALSAAVVVLVFSIFLAASAVVVYITRMTKKILRAIDLATSPPS